MVLESRFSSKVRNYRIRLRQFGFPEQLDCYPWRSKSPLRSLVSLAPYATVRLNVQLDQSDKGYWPVGAGECLCVVVVRTDNRGEYTQALHNSSHLLASTNQRRYKLATASRGPLS